MTRPHDAPRPRQARFVAARVAVTALALAFLGAACDDGDEAGTGTTAPGTAATTAGSGAGTEGTTAPAGVVEDCSAAGSDREVGPQDGLPDAVARMRQEIAAAAARCDLDGLEALALRDGATFQYSFGQTAPQGAAEYWRDREREGERVLATLVGLLALPHGTAAEPQREYFWPAAHGGEPTDADWEALEAVYTDEEVEQFRESGSYLGYRVGITADGDWTYFVAGD